MSNSITHTLEWSLLLLLGVCFGCVDIIELEPATDKELGVVIQGKLVIGERSSVEVKVRRFPERDRFAYPQAVPVQSVTLVEETSGKSQQIPFVPQRSTFYTDFSDEEKSMPLEPGRRYHMEVVLENGSVYHSRPETPYLVPSARDVTFQLVTNRGQNSNGIIFEQKEIVVRVNTDLARPDGQGNANLLWNIRSTFKLTDKITDPRKKSCFLTYDVVNSTLPLVVGSDLREGREETFEIRRMPANYQFAEGHLMEIIQEGLSDQAIVYWDRVRRVLNRSGTIAEDPVGEVGGNWFSVNDSQEVVQGLFYAVTQDTIYRYISRTEAGRPSTFCPQPFNPFSEIVRICDDCLRGWTEGPATLIEPPNWGG